MANTTQPRLCFSYLRFSRAEQAKGDSTRRQTELREAYLTRNNLVLDSTRMFSDQGISGFHGKNALEGNLAEFLHLVQGGHIPQGSVLLIESIDRLSRDQIRPARNRLESILEAGIEIHTLSPERVYTKNSLDDIYALFEMLVEFSRAHEFSKQLGSRIGAAWSSKREKARTNQTPLSKRPPAWLRVVENQIQIIPDRGQVVELIYQLCTDGMGVNLIAQELTRRGIPTFTDRKTWSENYVAKVLRGDAAIGDHTPYRRDPVTRKQIPAEKIPGLFPPVISETLNAQAKTALRQRKNKGGRVDLDGVVHPFSGLLRTHTGAPLRIRYRNMSRKTSRLMAYLQDQETGGSYPLHRFETLMLSWMTNLEHKPEPVSKQSQEITTLQERITQLDHQVHVFSEKISQGESFESFLILLSTAEKDRKFARQRLQELRAIAPVGQGLSQMSRIIERLGPLSPDHLLDRPREINLELRAALRRTVKLVEVTIGQEHRSCLKKSLYITTTFKDGVKVTFSYRPIQDNT